MKLIKSAVVYTALMLSANTALGADPGAIEALRDGSMKKLVVHETPQDVSARTFTSPDGAEHALADWQGKFVVVNFWATWCAPCRKEMPSLDALEEEFGGEDFAVVPVATGRNSAEGIRRFFDEIGVKNLPVFLDPRQGLARDMAVLGLPITVILDRDGREIARLTGDADWQSDSARAIISALLAGG